MAISAHKTRTILSCHNFVGLDDLKWATKKLDAHLAVPEPEHAASVPTPAPVNY
jgi:hypothetical protein